MIIVEFIHRPMPDVYKLNKALRKRVEQALGNPMDVWAENILGEFTRHYDKPEKDILIRCYTSTKPSGTSTPTIDMIALGFNGDVEEFTITYVHELLHYYHLDEDWVEQESKRFVDSLPALAK